MSAKHNFTYEQVKEAVERSYSIAGVIRRLGLSPNGGSSYPIANKLIKQYDLNTSHFTGQAHNKGKILLDKRRSIEDYLNNKVRIGSFNLREKLFQENLKEKCCEQCKRTEWEGFPIRS